MLVNYKSKYSLWKNYKFNVRIQGVEYSRFHWEIDKNDVGNYYLYFRNIQILSIGEIKVKNLWFLMQNNLNKKSFISFSGMET
jgi:hypothetical protein